MGPSSGGGALGEELDGSATNEGRRASTLETIGSWEKVVGAAGSRTTTGVVDGVRSLPSAFYYLDG